jgi:hypothetical protein
MMACQRAYCPDLPGADTMDMARNVDGGGMALDVPLE